MRKIFKGKNVFAAKRGAALLAFVVAAAVILTAFLTACGAKSAPPDAAPAQTTAAAATTTAAAAAKADDGDAKAAETTAAAAETTKAAATEAATTKAAATQAATTKAADGKIKIAPGIKTPPLDPSISDEDIPAAYGLPIVPPGETIKLTIFQSGTAVVDDLNNNTFTKLVEDHTGLTLDFIIAPSADATTKRNLLLSSGDYPEIISGGMSRNEMALYAEQGIFIALDDYIDDYAPNAKVVWENYISARLSCRGLDNRYYGLPSVNDCFHCDHGNGRLWYYTPWVQTLGVGLPETTDELKDFLIAIKTQDPNGNGKQDEVPLAFHKNEAIQAVRYFMNMFMVYPPDGYRVDDGKIVAAFVTEPFKQGLLYMRDLYANGLILEDAFSIESEDLIKIGENPEAPTVGSVIGWGPESAVRKAGESMRWFEYFVLAPVKGPTGERNASYTGGWSSAGAAYFITDKCMNVEAAVRLGDVLLGEYYSTGSYIGPRGVGWDYAGPDDISMLGGKANRKEIITYGTQEKNTSWDQANLTYRPSEYRMALAAEGGDIIVKYLDGDFSLMKQAASYSSYNEIMKYYMSKKFLHPYVYGADRVPPPLLYDADAGAEVADIKAVMDPYFMQKIASFVMGTDDIETGFAAYVSEMESMGLNTLVKHMQAAFEKIDLD